MKNKNRGLERNRTRLLLLTVALLLGAELWANPIPAVGTLNQVNLAGGSTGMEALNGNSQTVTFAAGAQSGGFDIQLACPSLLGKIQVTVAGTADLHWQAVNGSQVIDLWSRQQSGLYDISIDNMVSDHLRLVVHAPDLGTISLSSIRVFGEDPSTLYHRIIPIDVRATAQSSFYYGPQNLFDGDISTDWKVSGQQDSDRFLPDLKKMVRGSWLHWWKDWSGVYDNRVDALLPDGKRIAHVQVYFGQQAVGTVEIQGLFSGQWKSLGTVNAVPSSWGTIANPYPNDLVQEVQVITRAPWSAPVQADVGEVVIWGTGNWPGDSYQDPITQGNDASGNQFSFFTWGTQNLSGDDYQNSSDSGWPPACDQNNNSGQGFSVPDGYDSSLPPYYEFAIQGQSAALPAVQVCGQSVGTVSPYISDGTTTYYKVLVPASILNQGENLFSVGGVDGQWVYGRLHVPAVDGSAPWSNSEGILGDGWKYIPVQAGDPVECANPSILPGGQFQLYGDGSLQSGSDRLGWTEPPFESTYDGNIYPDWPTGHSLKVESGPNGNGEVKYWGLSSLGDAPKVQVLWPQNGQRLAWGDVQEHTLVGYLSGSPQSVLVNGHAVQTKGNLFWIPLTSVGLQKGKIDTITVTSVVDGKVTTNQIVAVAVATPTLWLPGVDAKPIVTSNASYTISGQTFVQGVEVFIGSQVVIPDHGLFSADVPLQPGINTVPVRLVYLATGAELDTATATLERTAPGILLTVDGQGHTTYVSQPWYTVSGTVISQNRAKVTIDGQAVSVSGSHYQGRIVLRSGANSITVAATDGINKASAQVTVFLDTRAPTMTVTSPVANSWVNHQVTITGTITDPAPAYVWINGIKYSAATGTFNFAIPVLQEGSFTYQLQPENQAGSFGILQHVTFKVDNTPPAAFAIGTNVVPTAQGWTNVGTPTITFSTIDALSGVGHYDYSLDQGATWTTVTSPFTLPALPNGIDTVEVRAVDNAGNATTESITFQVDTTIPQVPSPFAATPGAAEIDLSWTGIPESGVVSSLPLTYLVERSPAWSDGIHSTTSTQYVDPGLAAGATYSYRVRAMDVAGNLSAPSAWATAEVGFADVSIAPSSGGLVLYKNVVLDFSPGALPNDVTAVTVNEIPLQYLNNKPQYPIVGPIFQFRVTKTDNGVTTQYQNAAFNTAVAVQIAYDPSQIPAGLNEENLKPYYYDALWGRWLPLKTSAVDPVNHTLTFYTTHFSDCAIEATRATDQSVEELRNTKFSPFGTNVGQKPIQVSPQGGNVTAQFTELVLPGKNHFDLVLNRIYDSSVACVDASTKTAVYTNDGDSPWYLGQGWRFDFPWMKWNGSGLWIKGLDAQIISADQGSMATSHNGSSIVATLTVHESVDIVFQATFAQSVQYTASNYGPPSQNITYAFASGKLLYKDGREVDYDSQGRVTAIWDSAGINAIRFVYNGNFPSTITDSLGRIITFTPQSEGSGSAAYTQISSVQLAAGSAAGSESLAKAISYTYNDADDAADSQLMSETDVGGRVWSYLYTPEVIQHTYPDYHTYNYPDTVSALNSVSGPGIGTTTITYQLTSETLSTNLAITVPNQAPVGPSTITKNVVAKEQVDDLQAASMSLSDGTNTLRSSAYVFTPSDLVTFTVDTTVPVYFFIFQVGSQQQSVQYTNSDVLQQYYTAQSIVYTYQGPPPAAPGPNGPQKSTQTTNFTYIVKERNELSMSSELSGGSDSVYEVVPYPTDVTTITNEIPNDKRTDTQTLEWDTGSMRMTRLLTTRSGAIADSAAVNSSEVDLTYDGWGNVATSVTTTIIGTRQTKLEQDNSYYNVAGIADTSSWLGSGSLSLSAGDVPGYLTRNQHALVATTQRVITGYTPSSINPDTVTEYEAYTYTGLGQLASDQKYTGTQWAATNYSYDPTSNSPSYGELIKTVGPVALGAPTGQVTNISYDFTSHLNAYWVTTTKASVDLGTGKKVDLATLSAFDLLMGTCSWSQDPLLRVTSQQYDALGRVTQIVEPDDGLGNPITTIVYDDTNLTSTVTNPLGLQTEYSFNSVGQIREIQKTSSKVSPLDLDKQGNPLGPEVITSTLDYADSYNYTQPTEVHGPYSTMETDQIPTRNSDSLVTTYTYDASGRVTSVTSPGSSIPKSISYDDTHNTVTTTDELKNATVVLQDWNQKTLSQSVIADNTTTITVNSYYDGLGREIAVTDGNGNLFSTCYNSFGLISRELSPVRFIQTTEVTPEVDKTYYPDGSLLQSSQLSLGGGDKTAVVNYTSVNGLGWPLEVQTPVTTADPPSASPSVHTLVVDTIYDALGRKLQTSSGYAGGTFVAKQWTYDSHGRVLTATDELNHTTIYTYDEVGNRTTVTDPLGNVITLDYDFFNRLIKATLPPVQIGQADPVIKFRYDGHGNLVERLEADGVEHSYTYNLRNEVLTETTTDGKTSYLTTHGYDNAGREVSVKAPSGHIVGKVYDGAGRVLEQASGGQNDFTTDSNGSLVIAPNDNAISSTQFTYDLNGNKRTVTDGNNHTTTYQNYTPENKPQTILDAKNESTQITYDRWGRQVQTVDGEQNVRTFQYDELGRMTSETTPTSGTLSYVYDAWNDVAQKQDARGTVFAQSFDAAHRLYNVTATNTAQTQSAAYTYDDDNNLTSASNGSVSTAYDTNPYGLITQVTQTVGPSALTMAYAYDNRQRVTQITNPDQSQVNYTYNSLGQLSTMPGWIDNPLDYDPTTGLLQNFTLDNGVQRTFSYDRQDRLDALTYTANGNQIKSYGFTYDQVSNITYKTVDGNTPNQYTYDAINQLIGANEYGWFQQPAQATAPAYGSVDKDYQGLAVLKFNVQSTDNVTLDTGARSFGVDLGSTMGVSEIKLTPNAQPHRVRQRDLTLFVSTTNNPNDYSVVTGYKFTNQGGSILLQLATVVQARYIKVKTDWDDRDINGLITDSYATFTNTASALLQVVVLKTSQNDNYTYDRNGNRTSSNVDGNQQNAVYYKNAAGGNLSLIQYDGTWYYKYDPNGNMILKTKAWISGDPYNPATGAWNTTCDTTEYWTYTWDLENRLTSVQHDGAPLSSYVYDAAGYRVQRTGSDGTTVYMYSTSGSLAYSSNATTGLTRSITYIGSTIVGWIDTQTGTSGSGSTTYYATTDQVGSVTQVTNSTGTVVWASEYTPYGGLAGAQGTYTFTGFFTGKDIDPDTGLYYFNARWYDPSLGRFVSEDPAGQGTNWYSYCGNGPLTHTDPTGKIFGVDDLIFWCAVAIGTYLGGVEANGGNFNPLQWQWNAQTFEGMGAGAVIGALGAITGAQVLSLCTASSGVSVFASWGWVGAATQSGIIGAVTGAEGGFLNSWVFGNMSAGLFQGDLQQDFEAAAEGAASGFIAGFAEGAIFGFPQAQQKAQARLNEQRSTPIPDTHLVESPTQVAAGTSIAMGGPGLPTITPPDPGEWIESVGQPIMPPPSLDPEVNPPMSGGGGFKARFMLIGIMKLLS